MKRDFTASLPSICSTAVEPLRRADPAAVIDALKALPVSIAPDGELAAELIALAYVHADTKVRKKATTLVPAAAQFKAAYKSMAACESYVIEERVRAFEHPLRLGIAKAMLFHRKAAGSIVFEGDPPLRAAMLEMMAELAKREQVASLPLSVGPGARCNRATSRRGRRAMQQERVLAIHQLYWSWMKGAGSVTFLDLRTLPAALFSELGALRERYDFDGLSFHGCSLTTLPETLVEARPWLKHLDLTYANFAEVPPVLFECTELEQLHLGGTPLEDISPAIRKLTKLRYLDIGNSKKMKTIPEAVCALDKLEYLRIGNGSIRELPAAIGQMSTLRELEMQSTRISKLPRTLADLPNLEKVHMRFCDKITREDMRAVVGANVQIDA